MRARAIRRRRLAALAGLLLAGIAAIAVTFESGGPTPARMTVAAGMRRPAAAGPAPARGASAGGGRRAGSAPARGGLAGDARTVQRSGPTAAPGLLPTSGPRGPYAVGVRVVRLVDPRRRIRLAGGFSRPRPLVTYVRYPALGPASASDLRGAAAARGGGPYPLIVFGHGFAVTPALYARLLRAWARAGYVVAAPIFPLGNANAPGGPDEADLVNQPADVRLTISRMLAASNAHGSPLAGVIDPRRVAVAGQSDGGDTALAVAYDAPYRDARVRAAVILSGAEIPTLGAYRFPAGGPPLLATQGSADTINPPSLTHTFFAAASRPKFLLSLSGAGHLPPYTAQQPQLSIVERVTTAFLDHYLKQTATLRRVRAEARAPGIASLQAAP